MSVVFQHLDIPKNCMECEWRDAEACGECELMIGNPFGTLKEQYNHCPFRVISKRHPLVPVPQHGRLIDADALLQSHSVSDGIYFPDAYIPATAIKAAPTIIPAEEG